MKKNVISRRNLPTRMPVLTTVICWLVLDRIAAPGWVQGAAWTFIGLLWVASLANFADERDVDVFKDRK